jgi:hypothetical protein
VVASIRLNWKLPDRIANMNPPKAPMGELWVNQGVVGKQASRSGTTPIRVVPRIRRANNQDHPLANAQYADATGDALGARSGSNSKSPTRYL